MHQTRAVRTSVVTRVAAARTSALEFPNAFPTKCMSWSRLKPSPLPTPNTGINTSNKDSLQQQHTGPVY